MAKIFLAVLALCAVASATPILQAGSLPNPLGLIETAKNTAGNVAGGLLSNTPLSRLRRQAADLDINANTDTTASTNANTNVLRQSTGRILGGFGGMFRGFVDGVKNAVHEGVNAGTTMMRTGVSTANQAVGHIADGIDQAASATFSTDRDNVMSNIGNAVSGSIKAAVDTTKKVAATGVAGTLNVAKEAIEGSRDAINALSTGNNKAVQSAIDGIKGFGGLAAGLFDSGVEMISSASSRVNDIATKTNENLAGSALNLINNASTRINADGTAATNAAGSTDGTTNGDGSLTVVVDTTA